jgi:DNA-binding IclR family transcriptional regulator
MPKKQLEKNTQEIQSRLPRQGNRSIVVGVALLRVIAAFGRPAALGEIAKSIQMTPTRTQRYLLGLVGAGLVEQNPLTQRYDLGFQVVELGVLALGRTDAVRLANESLLGLSKEANAPALVIVWGTHGPTVIRCEQAEMPSVIRVREGRVLSLQNSSSGRVFLTHMPVDVVDPILRNEVKEAARNERTEKIDGGFDAEQIKAEIRKYGVGRSIGEESDHLASLSAPVFGANGTLALCLTLLNIRGRLDTSYDGRPATLLKETAMRISARLGHLVRSSSPSDSTTASVTPVASRRLRKCDAGGAA